MRESFTLRAPWYVRERGQFDLRDPRALRPEVQKYGDADFVKRMLADPRDSLRFVAEDRWSYPVPISPTSAHGRERFATHRLHTTKIRKLFQATHDRYYAVLVEVFCDQPGLPRAGGHADLQVGFVMRRHQTTLHGSQADMRKLARQLIVSHAAEQGWPAPKATEADSPDLYLAETAWERQFAEDHGDLVSAVSATHAVQAWLVGDGGGGWTDLDAPPGPDEPVRSEEEIPMWRLPDSAAVCEAGRSRSLWFGVVPTYSGEHWVGPGPDQPLLPKLDDHEIYELCCFVRSPAEHEGCPPVTVWSAPTQPFRLAAPFDPDGTKNHTVTIPVPDLRRLGARAGQKLGQGGARIVTPPGSSLPPVKFADLSAMTPSGKTGAGDSICFFAFELFFMVALFLFLLFLPIIVFMFQLWFLLALRFCLPGSAIDLLKQFLAQPGNGLDQVIADPGRSADLDAVTGIPGSGKLLKTAPTFIASTIGDLVEAMDPAQAEKPRPPRPASSPPDPLCGPPAPP